MRDSNGRPQLQLKGGGRKQQARVSVLVAEAFIGPRPAGMEVCHFPDRDPWNNRPENLRWDTRHENNLDQIRHGTHGNGSRDTCTHGHLIDGVNKDGSRFCKTCARTKDVERRAWRNFILRVQRARGKPSHCIQCDRKDSATRYEWVHIEGDPADPRNWVRMCIGCHRAFNRKSTDDARLDAQRERWREYWRTKQEDR